MGNGPKWRFGGSFNGGRRISIDSNFPVPSGDCVTALPPDDNCVMVSDVQ